MASKVTCNVARDIGKRRDGLSASRHWRRQSDNVPADERGFHEIKFDGYRIQLSGPRTLLPALVRQLDRNVPRGAHDPRASVRVGAAYDRFQKQDELFRKHVRRVADGRFSGSVAAGGL
jgi:hypothetical protein